MYVVTGGAGFIGSNLLAVMQARGLGPCAVIDRCDSPHKTRNLAKRTLAHVVPPEETFAFLDSHAGNVTAVVHLGALTSTTERDLDKLNEVNVRLSRALWTWMFSSMFLVRPGNVKLLDPTRACEPTTSSFACVM